MPRREECCGLRQSSGVPIAQSCSWRERSWSAPTCLRTRPEASPSLTGSAARQRHRRFAATGQSRHPQVRSLASISLERGPPESTYGPLGLSQRMKQARFAILRFRGNGSHPPVALTRTKQPGAHTISFLAVRTLWNGSGVAERCLDRAWPARLSRVFLPAGLSEQKWLRLFSKQTKTLLQLGTLAREGTRPTPVAIEGWWHKALASRWCAHPW